MRAQQQLRNRQQPALQFHQIIQIALTAGTVSGVVMAVLLFALDFNRWQGSTMGYHWQLSSEVVQPGSWVTASLDLPEARDLEDFAIVVDLPAQAGFGFVPGSLEIHSGTLAGASIVGYSGGQRLHISNIARQKESLKLKVSIQVPSDMKWIGQSVEIAPELHYRKTVLRSRPAVLHVTAPELEVQARNVLHDAGELGYEFTVRNPTDGLDFVQLDKSFSLEVQITGVPVELLPTEIEILSEHAHAAPRLQEGLLVVDQLVLGPGQSLSLFVPVTLRPGADPATVKLRASVKAGELIFGKSEEVKGESFGVKLGTLEAEAREERALLSWEVKGERANKGFAVEHSTDGHRYEQIAYLPGSDDHDAHLVYRFETEALSAGRHFFRLRQESFSDHPSHTRTLGTFIGRPDSASLDLSHFSSREGGFVQLTLPRSQRVVVWLVDEAGRHFDTLYQGHVRAGTPYDIHLPKNGIPPGAYTVEVSGTQAHLKAPIRVERVGSHL